MSKLAGVVILYHPNTDVFNNIKTYINSIDRLYIIDNTEHGDHISTIEKELLSLKQCTLLHKGENLGIAKALNLALDHSLKENFTWLMTMDQDSAFEAKYLKKYLDDFKKLNKENVALVSAMHNPKFINDNFTNPFEEKEIVMTSANIVNINAALSVGGYDERLFIDEVDHSFCFALHLKKYIILENKTVYVKHMLGTPYMKNNKVKLYPPERLYYMIRNYLYIKERYKEGHQLFFKKRDMYLFTFFAKHFLYGKQKLKQLNMLLNGIKDYNKKRFGKLYEMQ